MQQLPMYTLKASYTLSYTVKVNILTAVWIMLILNMKLLVCLPTCSSKRQSSMVKSGPKRGKWLRQVQSSQIVCICSVYVLETTSCRDKHCKTCHLSMKWKQKYSGWGTVEGIMLCGRAEIRAYNICWANFFQLLF